MGKTRLKVKLLCCTPEPEDIIAMSAKLCYSSSDVDSIKQVVEEKDQSKYIQRLMSLGHLSPIEHASFTFGIEGVSRALLAQITRHRIASFSVQSQRYVSKANDEGCFPYIVPPSIEALGDEAVDEFEKQMATIQKWYNEWVEKLGGPSEKANEDARFVLPNAAETKMVVTMNARELLHFFRLRCCNRAQWEIRELAWEMLRLVIEKAPHIFNNSGPGCLESRCPEGKMTCGKQLEVKKRREELG